MLQMTGSSSKVVFITGCSSGLGRALAFEFSRLGHRVIASARDSRSIEDLAHFGISTITLDVTSNVAVRRAISEALAIAGRLDIVINNAGTLVAGPLAEVPIAQFGSSLDTNIVGAARVVQEVFPWMSARRWG